MKLSRRIPTIDAGIVWSGPSAFDGSPIVAIVTGLDGSSTNPKTGAMAQLWILRADMAPMEAVQSGDDAAICGSCIHRGTSKTRSCYVTVANAPQAVFGKFSRGGYPTITARDASDAARARQLPMRLGAYGDPAALPVSVLYDLTIGLDWTGYTHSWQTCGSDYARYLMASVDTPAMLESARAAGWRTFRTRLQSEPLAVGEIVCPASDEAGKRSTCADCQLCSGVRPTDTRRSIAIVVHGSGASRYIALRQVAA